MLTATYDERHGIVCTTAQGVATIEEFEAYLLLVIPLLNRSRTRHGRSLHLVDATDNPVQSKDVFGAMCAITAKSARENDCCAVLLRSMLARMQINRMPKAAGKQFFDNPLDARAWLLEQAGGLHHAAL